MYSSGQRRFRYFNSNKDDEEKRDLGYDKNTKGFHDDEFSFASSRFSVASSDLGDSFRYGSVRSVGTSVSDFSYVPTQSQHRNKWRCMICTFENKFTASVCEQCLLPRGSKPLKSDRSLLIDSARRLIRNAGQTEDDEVESNAGPPLPRGTRKSYAKSSKSTEIISDAESTATFQSDDATKGDNDQHLNKTSLNLQHFEDSISQSWSQATVTSSLRTCVTRDHETSSSAEFSENVGYTTTLPRVASFNDSSIGENSHLLNKMAPKSFRLGINESESVHKATFSEGMDFGPPERNHETTTSVELSENSETNSSCLPIEYANADKDEELPHACGYQYKNKDSSAVLDVKPTDDDESNDKDNDEQQPLKFTDPIEEQKHLLRMTDAEITKIEREIQLLEDRQLELMEKRMMFMTNITFLEEERLRSKRK